MRALILATLAAASVGGIGFVACSSDPPASSSGGTKDGGNGGDDSGQPGDDGGPSGDGGKDAAGDGSCVHAPPLDGGNPCGALDFGKPAALFGMTDASAGETYKGGPLEPGIYDAIVADRASGLGGSWRETFVVDATGKFTRIRQIQATAAGALGPISYRAGTFATDGGNEIAFTYTCAITGDAAVEAGPDTLPYDALRDSCGTTDYRYGATGIRVTLKRR